MSLGLGYGVKSRHVCGLPGFGTSGERWISGVAGLIRPHSRCPLSPSWQVDRGIYSSTTQPAGTHTPDWMSSSAAPCWRRVAQYVCPSHPSHRWTHTDRLMENGVPPSVAVAPLGQTETEVCLLQSLRDRCALPQEVFPTRWVTGGLSLLTGPRRDRRERSAWLGSFVSPGRLLFKQCCRYRRGDRAGMGLS